MKRYLILTGGSVDFPSASVFMKKNSYTAVIAEDGGMNAAKKLEIIPVKKVSEVLQQVLQS